jgi:hypothetical protein
MFVLYALYFVFYGFLALSLAIVLRTIFYTYRHTQAPHKNMGIKAFSAAIVLSVLAIAIALAVNTYIDKHGFANNYNSCAVGTAYKPVVLVVGGISIVLAIIGTIIASRDRFYRVVIAGVVLALLLMLVFFGAFFIVSSPCIH